MIDETKLNTDGNPYKVMLVDDSPVIRASLRKLLEDNEIKIVAEAENGKIAIEKVIEADADVILLDIEMPEMDGITALPELLRLCPHSRVIMVSTLTKTNAAIGIQALSKGASDYIEKPSSDMNREEFKDNLIRKVKTIGKSSRQSVRGDRHLDSVDSYEQQPEQIESIEKNEPIISKAPEPLEERKEATIIPQNTDKKVRIIGPEVLAIGCSTGGPQALGVLFQGLKNKIDNIPIFITQHMPATFTTFLAKNISQVSGALCVEGEDGMPVEPGIIYLAPGDYHMTVENIDGKKTIKLNQDPPENFCRPSVDPMLRSLINVYGDKICTLIMTGMGSDGIGGARAVSERGGRIIIQDEATSIVWGMPGAVAQENLQEMILPLDDLAPKLLEICKGI